MSAKKDPPPQRNALAPGMLGAAALFVGPALLDSDAFLVIRFVVAILAAIVAWFALQAKQWWWAVAMAAVVVIWNPAYPFAFPSAVWTPLHIAGAVAFLVAGSLIKLRRES